MCSRGREDLRFAIYDLRFTRLRQTDHAEPVMTREEMKARTKAYADTMKSLL